MLNIIMRNSKKEIIRNYMYDRFFSNDVKMTVCGISWDIKLWKNDKRYKMSRDYSTFTTMNLCFIELTTRHSNRK